MKSILLLVASAGAFAALLVQPYREAAVVVEAEDAVRALVARREPGRVHGYVMEWSRVGAPPDLFVARPEEPGRDGSLWYVTADGDTVFALNTTLFRVPPDGPDLEPMRRFLAIPGGEREDADLPFGWKRVLH